MSFVQKTPDVDPGRFNDPVAKQTEWGPLKRGGANFRTHKLVQADANRLEFQPTVMTRVFSLIFVLVGLFVLVPFAFDFEKFSSDFSENPIILTVFIIPIVFPIVGLVFYFTMGKKRVFDRSYNLYYKGKVPIGPMDPSQIKDAVQLGEIHALQIIPERVTSKNGSYRSYELNLILKDGRRINVVDHGNRNKLLEDANTLAQFLGVPVWDAS